MKILKIFLFLLYCLIKNVFSIEILQKYSTITTYESYVIFNSTDFSEGKEIYLRFDAKDICDDYLYYEYYDDVDLISRSKPKYSQKQEFSETTTINGKITKYVLYFTIKKVNYELNGLKGNYILLNYDCNGKVEIENTEKNEKNSSLIVVFVCIGVFLFVIIIIVVICCYCQRMKRASRLQNIYPENQFYYGQPVYQQYGNGPYIYQTPIQIQNPNMNMNMMVNNNPSPNNMPYMNVPQNVQIIQNGAISQNQNFAPSSNREKISQNFEKPKPIS